MVKMPELADYALIGFMIGSITWMIGLTLRTGGFGKN